VLRKISCKTCAHDVAPVSGDRAVIQLWTSHHVDPGLLAQGDFSPFRSVWQ
jgi:hypothetical protein